ncbi:TPA: acylphosphatase [candidate division CPR2 bacterium]|uniref:acylphosphatase n=1 Tax=candidate division CPR2 bacterium GW2011_GWC1_41_48 TaxID=1618344 RepID=A0A0G0Z7W0_UNCC2|nr:MAG: Acylphosphatase [candidate division CPR2 bacterium GW2011_GWC2_39_35]KKS09093.1 MAG: Acylphosphatase [candidate division CPR2 bacterium GW2011_GWC1_41_48]HBG81834.1 acylphosphatase [candidate division CPR2 bacterium]HCL99993.1 acylphosphatase [candidate division CPR2 bacterium]
MKRNEITVSGDVQGVFYRHHALKKAKILKVKGWIRNEVNGEISMVVEGNDDALKNFVDWVWEGSPMSDVADVEIEEKEATGEFEEFRII